MVQFFNQYQRPEDARVTPKASLTADLLSDSRCEGFRGFVLSMPLALRKLIFDTSAINRLREDKDSVAITRAIGLLYRVGITETVISEVIATENEDDRRALLEVFKRLLNCGNCMMPFNWILEEQAKAYQSAPANYDWKRLNVRVRMAEEEIARQELLHDLSEQTRREQKQWDKEFIQIYRNARPAFQGILLSNSETPSLRAVTEKLLSIGGAHLQIGAGLVERATGVLPDEATTKDFMERCPPFKALLVALCFTQYDRCIRRRGQRPLGKA